MSFTEGVDAKGQKVADTRPKHDQHYLDTVYKCGQRRKHEIRIARANWPPTQHPNLNDRPHVTGTCDNCGAVCIVYDPVPSDMTVILFGEKGSEQGRVQDEVGEVLDESEVPQAGGVVEEPEPDQRRRGRR